MVPIYELAAQLQLSPAAIVIANRADLGSQGLLIEGGPWETKVGGPTKATRRDRSRIKQGWAYVESEASIVKASTICSTPIEIPRDGQDSKDKLAGK